MSINHYENFPVASVLCPPAWRPVIAAIYGFARTADDLADEGEASATTRLADLEAYRNDLTAVAHGGQPSARWAVVFEALRTPLKQHGLPLNLLNDLLSAFEQDVTHGLYVTRTELLRYCQLSANPVGRLLLHLYGVKTPLALQQSDAICSALQLINFWQDLSVDLKRGRCYLPHDDCTRAGVNLQALLHDPQDTPLLRALVRELASWAQDLMLQGAPLVHTLPGRVGWELRLVVQGGLRILEKIEQLNFATVTHRPVLRWFDAPLLLWRALRMRHTCPLRPQEAA